MTTTLTEPDFGSCTCHSILERSDGMTYSLAILGVECGSCEARGEWYWEQARRAELTEAQRTAEDVAHRWNHARYVTLPRRRPVRWTDAWGTVHTEPPF